MSDFTFLTEEQCFGDKKLDILKKRGITAAITDFSILLGGCVSSTHHVDNGNSIEGRIGYYWTKSDDRDNDARMVNDDDDFYIEYVTERLVGARPVLPFSSISSISTNGESGKKQKMEF